LSCLAAEDIVKAVVTIKVYCLIVEENLLFGADLFGRCKRFLSSIDKLNCRNQCE